MQRHFKVKRSIYVLSALYIVLLLSAGCGDKAAAGSAETARSEAVKDAAVVMEPENAGDAVSSKAGTGGNEIAGTNITGSAAAGAEAAGTDPTGSAAAVTDHSAEAQKESEDAAPDTKPALKPGMIFNTQKNELGQLVGGQPGDQTGKETRIEAYPSYYRADSYPWDYILHCTDDELRLEAVRLACAGAANDMLGYDSGDLKNTFWEEVQAADYDPALVRNPCSANCATSVLTFYRCAAIRLGIEEAMEIDCTENVWMMEEVLMETGLFEKITDEERLHSPDRNMAGDIYTAESRHTIMQVSDGKDVENR